MGNRRRFLSPPRPSERPATTRDPTPVVSFRRPRRARRPPPSSRLLCLLRRRRPSRRSRRRRELRRRTCTRPGPRLASPTSRVFPVQSFVCVSSPPPTPLSRVPWPLRRAASSLPPTRRRKRRRRGSSPSRATPPLFVAPCRKSREGSYPFRTDEKTLSCPSLRPRRSHRRPLNPSVCSQTERETQTRTKSAPISSEGTRRRRDASLRPVSRGLFWPRVQTRLLRRRRFFSETPPPRLPPARRACRALPRPRHRREHEAPQESV